MRFTIFGASGFIGRHLEEHLVHAGHNVCTPQRGLRPESENLGHIIYAIGLTADFRTRPFDTVRAHVSVLSDHLEHCQFDSFLYLSSTRVYAQSDSSEEDMQLKVCPLESSDLYNISKLMGESLCLNSGRSRVRIARLSNIVGIYSCGDQNFLASLCHDAKHGQINLRTDLSSEKDYLYIDDAVSALANIATDGKHQIYNVARGKQTTNRELVERLLELTRCHVNITPGAVHSAFPVIDTNRIASEMRFEPIDPLEKLPLILSNIS